jgi:tRNA (guanosine-2'-O-)-methyltransferase
MTPERFARLRRVLELRQPDLTVLMDGVHKPYNLSAVARSCDAVGVLELHAVPAADPKPLNRQVSAGTSKWIPMHVYETTEEATDTLRRQGLALVAAHTDPAAVDFREVDFTRPTAIVVGSELHGLSDQTLGQVDQTVVVPMVGMVRSLNVSVASAILLYEAQRQRQAAGMYATPRLDPERFEKLLFEWAHPEVARSCRAAGLSYPALDGNGEIVELPAGF